MVDYNVNVLGGLDLGGRLSGLARNIERKEEKERLLSERQEIQDLSLKAAQGDPDAIESLFAKNPQLGSIFEQRQAKMQQQENQANQAAFNDWAMKYATADQEQKKLLEQETLNDPMIDFDESDIAMSQNQKDFAVNAALYQSMGKDGYRQFFGGDKGLEKGTFQVKDTPTGFIRLNTATGEVSEIKSDSKLAMQQKRKEQDELKKQLDAEETVFNRSVKLRDEYAKKTKEFDKVDDAFDRVKASKEDPDAAGDLALIFNYMKMLDPGSVVREGEFATAQNAAGVPTQVRNLYGRLMSGERLSEGQRKMFVGRAEKLYSKAVKKKDENRKTILNIGKRYNLGELDIFGGAEQVERNTKQEKKALNLGDPNLSDEELLGGF